MLPSRTSSLRSKNWTDPIPANFNHVVFVVLPGDEEIFRRLLHFIFEHFQVQSAGSSQGRWSSGFVSTCTVLH